MFDKQWVGDMNTEEDYYVLRLAMTEDFSKLTKDELIDLVKYQQKRITEYYIKELDLNFQETE